MTILEPLTSAALGRSPYDAIIFPRNSVLEDDAGEGSSAAHHGLPYHQMWDERGRPANPETRRINKDVVRSHNEVMAVIGVAEPENSAQDDHDQTQRQHNEYEDQVGRRLLHFGGLVETACIWGVNGVRQRILLYKQYAQVPFWQTFELARGEQSLGAHFFAGFPTFAVSTWMEHYFGMQARDSKWFNAGMMYVRLHLAAYTFFQRNGILPASILFPNWRFFIPGSSISPIIIPQRPSSFTRRGLLTWVGAVVVGVAPFVGFYLYTKLYNSLARHLRIEIWAHLPRPSNYARNKAIQDAQCATAPATPPRAPQEAAPQPQAAVPPAITVDETPAPPPTGESGPQTPTGAPPQRQNTPNAVTRNNAGPAADDFGSDDEDVEVSATLISFDVESAEPVAEEASSPTTARAPGGVWSAELRPSVNDPHRVALLSNQPIYRDNMLRRLPATLATDVFACGPARLLTAPLAVLVWTRLCRPYMARLGMSLAGVYEPSLFGPFSRQGLINLLGAELMLVNILGHVWAGMTFLAYKYRLSDEEWDKPPTEKEKEALVQEVME